MPYRAYPSAQIVTFSEPIWSVKMAWVGGHAHPRSYVKWSISSSIGLFLWEIRSKIAFFAFFRIFRGSLRNPPAIQCRPLKKLKPDIKSWTDTVVGFFF